MWASLMFMETTKPLPTVLWLLCSTLIGQILVANAEITTDGSLGATTALIGPDFQISAELGQQSGANLFHSFSQFNLQQGESATFSGPNTIDNIISRITGGDRSTIDGLLRSNIDGANLFMVNPAGFIFGPNASVDISGSLHISSADYLRFANDERFYSDSTGNLSLSVAAPSAFGFIDPAPAAIQVDGTNIELDSQQTLSLVAGDIGIETGGLIRIEQGVVQLSAINNEGEVSINSGQITGVTDYADITIESDINVNGEGGGEMHLQGNNINMNQADLTAHTTGDGAPGSMTINANSKVTLHYASLDVDTFDTGDAGNIEISAESIDIVSGGFLSSSTWDEGNGGAVNINAQDMLVDRQNSRLTGVLVDSYRYGDTAGDAGELTLTIDNVLDIRNGGVIRSSSYGGGDAANLTITAAQLVIDGENSWRPTGILSGADGWRSTAKAGEIRITTNDLEILNDGLILSKTMTSAEDLTINADTIQLHSGGRIVSEIDNQGEASKIQVTANELTIDGGYSGIFSLAKCNCTANTGDILINSNDIVIRNEGQIGMDTYYGSGTAGLIHIESEKLVIDGAGTYTNDVTGIVSNTRVYSDASGGDVDIETNTLELLNGGIINTDTYSSGDGGSINIVTDTLSVSGDDVHRFTGISASARFSEGNAGNISIDANTIDIRNGGSIESNTSREGNSGDILIQSDLITIDREQNENFTGIQNIVRSRATGNAGVISIESDSLNLVNSGQISTSTSGEGNAGTTLIRTNELRIDGNYSGLLTGISSGALEGSEGNSGNITIESNNLSINNNAQIYTATFSQGNGGLLSITVNTLSLDNEAQINSSAQPLSSGDAGNIQINANDINIDNGAQIGSGTFSPGDAGSIFINTRQLNINQNNASEISGIASSAEGDSQGNAGTITINTEDLFLNNALIASVNSNDGNAGKIFVHATNNIVLDNNSLFNVYTDGGMNVNDPAAIEVSAQNLTINDDSFISAKAFGGANAGSIVLDIRENLELLNNSTINTESGQGGGGQIILQTPNVIQISDSRITSTVANGSGNGGGITLGGPEQSSRILLDNSQIMARANEGDGGNILLNASRVEIHNGSRIITESTLGGGGQINLQTPNLLYVSNSEISSTVANGTGNGGDISIGNTEISGLILLENNQILARANEGGGGNISLKADFIIRSPDNLISATASAGVDGEIIVNAADVDIENDMLRLDEEFADAEKWLPIPCARRDGNRVSSLVYQSSDGATYSPHSLRSKTVFNPKMTMQSTSSNKLASHDKEFLPALQKSGC